jgi:hypothetical protein
MGRDPFEPPQAAATRPGRDPSAAIADAAAALCHLAVTRDQLTKP